MFWNLRTLWTTFPSHNQHEPSGYLSLSVVWQHFHAYGLLSVYKDWAALPSSGRCPSEARRGSSISALHIIIMLSKVKGLCVKNVLMNSMRPCRFKILAGIENIYIYCLN